MGLRVWKDEPGLTWQVAQKRLRSSFHESIAPYTQKPIRDILDLGCSVGISTQELHSFYAQKQDVEIKTVGLDLSAYMLTVARWRDAENTISWVHGKAEATNFADNSFDLVTLQFLIHELPRSATEAIFQEVNRILRPNGIIAIVDNNPGSPVIQNLPPVLFTLMKSTEPWSDDYYTFDVEKALKANGFKHEITTPSDPRHRTIVATKN